MKTKKGLKLYKNIRINTVLYLLFIAVFTSISGKLFAQGDARVSAKISATQITIGDQVRLFIEAQNNASAGTLQWAAIPDSFNNLEVVERGKIDTISSGGITTYKQRLILTGFDSGVYEIPSFAFTVHPATGGDSILLKTDSFALTVQSVAVDTSKGFKPIKGIMSVNTTWRDYVAYIGGGAGLLLVAIAVAYFLLKRKKTAPPKPAGPVESLHDRSLRMLNELDAKQLWQKNKVKEYYVELTDIVRSYIEERFNTPALELTTDELLVKAQFTRDLQPYYSLLSGILHTADLAKFAKAQPLPQEHTDALENARIFIQKSKPIVIQINHENKPETTS